MDKYQAGKKKNDIMKFSDKWIKREKKNRSEWGNQTQKDKYILYSLISEY